MHLTFACINGTEAPVSLPPSLIPPNKAHLLPQYPQQTGYQQPQQTGYGGYQQPQQTGYQQPQQTGYQQPQQTGYQQPQQTGYGGYQQPQYTGLPAQEQEFSWDMTTDEMTSYQNIYAKYANDSGKVKCKHKRACF